MKEMAWKKEREKDWKKEMEKGFPMELVLVLVLARVVETTIDKKLVHKL